MYSFEKPTLIFDGTMLHGPLTPSPEYPSTHLHDGGKLRSLGMKHSELSTLHTTFLHVRSWKITKKNHVYEMSVSVCVLIINFEFG